MSSVRRALALSFAERYILIAIALLGNILIARLLTPEEIGIYSVSLAIIGIAQTLRDFGIGSFLIQEKNLNEDYIRTAFGFALLIGGTLFIIVYCSAPSIGHFYTDERLVQTVRISALNFLVLPFCSISLSLLRRQMAFDRLVTVTLISSIVGFIVTIGLAYLGFSVNSMAIGGVVGNVSTGIGSWIIRSDRTLFLPSFSEWRKVLSFGMQSSMMNLMIEISISASDLVLGKVLGFASVAIISRAQGLMNLFHRDMMGAIESVAAPAFSKAHREGELLESRYISSVAAITAIAWPFYGFTALFALEILHLMFGPQWDQAAVLVPIFCLAGSVAATFNLIPRAIIAVGRIDLMTKCVMIFQPIRSILVISAALIFQSLIVCAIAYFFVFLLQTPFFYAFKSKCIPNNYRDLLTNLWLSVKVTFGTLIVPSGLAFYISDKQVKSNLIILIIAFLIAFVAWIASLVVFRHPLTDDPLFKRFVNKTN